MSLGLPMAMRERVAQGANRSPNEIGKEWEGKSTFVLIIPVQTCSSFFFLFSLQSFHKSELLFTHIHAHIHKDVPPKEDCPWWKVFHRLLCPCPRGFVGSWRIRESKAQLSVLLLFFFFFFFFILTLIYFSFV
jgi:hypothetical protein